MNRDKVFQAALALLAAHLNAAMTAEKPAPSAEQLGAMIDSSVAMSKILVKAVYGEP